MSKKQDRQGARTPADVERRFGGSFSEIEETLKKMDSTIQAELSLKIGSDESGKIISMINASADVIIIKGNRLTIESTNFELTQDGKVKAKAGEIGGCSIVNGVLQIKNANIAEKLTAEQINAENLKVKAANVEGKLTAEQINANGMNIAGFTVTEEALKKEETDHSIELNSGTYPRLHLKTIDEDDGSIERMATYDSTGVTISKESGATFNGGWFTLVAGNVNYILYLDHDTGTVKFRMVNTGE